MAKCNKLTSLPFKGLTMYKNWYLSLRRCSLWPTSVHAYPSETDGGFSNCNAELGGPTTNADCPYRPVVARSTMSQFVDDVSGVPR